MTLLLAVLLAGCSETPLAPPGDTGGDSGHTGPHTQTKPTASQPTEQRPAPTDKSSNAQPALPGPTRTPEPGPFGVEATSSPVAVDDEVSYESGVSVAVASIVGVEGEASGIGEVAGPAIQVLVQITNSGADSLHLDSVIVNAYYEDTLIPALPLSGPDVSPFTGSLDAGNEAAATYVFAVPSSSREYLTVTVSYSPDEPLAVFEGSLP